MNPAAPFLLRDRPSSLPIRETIGAIVWVCGPRWNDWLNWRQDRLRWGDNGPWRRHDRLRRRRCRRAPPVMNPAAPGLLVGSPSVLCVDCTIERVNRSYWCRWWCPRGRRWGRGWRRREGCRWDGDGRCWQSRGRATPAHCHAAIILLSLGPHCIVRADRARNSAIVWRRCCCSRQEPQKQWNQ